MNRKSTITRELHTRNWYFAVILAISLIGLLNAKLMNAQSYRPTVASCATGKGFGSATNITGPLSYNGGFAVLYVSAPSNLQERCWWNQFSTVPLTLTQDYKLSFSLAGVTNTGSGSITSLTVTSNLGETSVDILHGENSVTIPYGTDMSTLTVTAWVRSGNGVACGGNSPPQCWDAEAEIDIANIVAAPL